ncbi:MAG: hypothetical protein ACTHU0_20985 [Kofleriaceae bacterium]
MVRALLLAACALIALGCGDNQPSGKHDAGVEPDAPADASALAPCLDRPTDLARPPAGQLPCELLPPGFTAP